MKAKTHGGVWPGQKRERRHLAQAVVGSLGVVGREPGAGDLLHVLEGVKGIGVEDLSAKRAVEPPDDAQWASQRAGSPQGADVASAPRDTPRPLPDPAKTYDTESVPRLARPNVERSRLERAAAQRLGLVETQSTLVCVTGGNGDGEIEADLRQLLGSVPANVPLSHIGVSARAVPGGFIGGVAVSARELRMAPFPRAVEPGASLELRGDVDTRFVKTRLAVTLPSGEGAAQESDRRFAFELPVPTAGVYGVEILGDGPTGAVVVMNVMVYAGVPEPSQGDEETTPAARSTGPRTAARAGRLARACQRRAECRDGARTHARREARRRRARQS